MRSRLRVRNQAGYAAIIVMSLMLLLSATSLVILKSATASQNNTRAGREFVQARNNIGSAQAEALTKLNTTGPTGWETVFEQTLSGGAQALKFSADLQGNQGTHGQNAPTLDITGTSNGRAVREMYSLRGAYYGGTVRDAEGLLSYGFVPAPAAAQSALNAHRYLWRSTVSTVADSTFYGTVTGMWALFGGTAEAAAKPTRIVSYADNARMLQAGSPSGWRSERSAFNGYLDTKAIDQMLSEDNFADCPVFDPYHFNDGFEPYTCSSNSTRLHTWTEPTPEPGLPPPPAPDKTARIPNQITTVVVDGNLTIDTDVLATGAMSRLHLFVNGRVTFAKRSDESGIPTRKIENVFIYAPRHVCATSNVRLDMTGSLACGAVSMPSPGGALQHAIKHLATGNAPVSGHMTARPNVGLPRIVYYTERLGFEDSSYSSTY